MVTDKDYELVQVKFDSQEEFNKMFEEKFKKWNPAHKFEYIYLDYNNRASVSYFENGKTPSTARGLPYYNADHLCIVFMKNHYILQNKRSITDKAIEEMVTTRKRNLKLEEQGDKK